MSAAAPQPDRVSCSKGKSLDVFVLDDRDQPVRDVAVELRNDADEALRGLTDDTGTARFDGLKVESVQLSLYESPAAGWTLLAATPIAARPSDPAQWQTFPAAAAEGETHVVEEGETVTSLAAASGVDPDELWNQNAALRQKRASGDILAAGDEVTIPAPARKSEKVAAGCSQSVRLRRKPASLRVRFLEADDRPRAELPYLLSIETASGDPVEDRAGSLDDEGFLEAGIPADAKFATVTLGLDGREVHRFGIGRLDPIDTPRGVQGRLRNLGYACGDENGELGPATAAAVRRFQQESGLSATGALDDATRAALLARYLS
jgi:hypothetical protein